MKDTIMLPIGQIIPYANNPRNNKDAVDKVAASLREFGFRQPIVVDKDNVVIAGHTRLLAAKKLKMEEVPVLVADDLTDEQVKAYRLADNKTAEFALWDDEKLDEELSSILDIDMEAFGFDLSITPEVVEDDFDPEPPAEPKAKRGDIYQLGRHRLMCGDSTILADVEALMNGNKADMLLTDPPYNVDYGALEQRRALWRPDKRVEEGNLVNIANDKMSDEDFRSFLTDAFSNARMVLNAGATFHIWFSEKQSVNFREACIAAGLSVRQQLIWIKNNHVLGQSDFQRIYEPVLAGDLLVDEEMEANGYEPCLYGWVDGKGHKWYKKRKERDVLYFDKPLASTKHPTMKPIKLFDYEMQCNTKEGESVLDLFGGSGTTIMACEQNNRIAYVMEYEPKFVDVILQRWEEFTDEKAVLLSGGDENGKETNGKP